MRVSLLTSTPEYLISDCAKVCYKNTTDKDLTQSLVHHHSHLAVLRFAFAVIKIEGISIPCQNQLVRSKHLDFLVESKRYVDIDKGGFEFVYPKNLTLNQQEKISAFWEQSKELYKELRLDGVKKEDARSILLANTSTNMNVAGNLQAWIDAIRLRVSDKAQLEIRTLFIKIWGLLREQYPNVFIDEMVVNGKVFEEWNSHYNAN